MTIQRSKLKLECHFESNDQLGECGTCWYYFLRPHFFNFFFSFKSLSWNMWHCMTLTSCNNPKRPGETGLILLVSVNFENIIWELPALQLSNNLHVISERNRMNSYSVTWKLELTAVFPWHQIILCEPTL